MFLLYSHNSYNMRNVTFGGKQCRNNAFKTLPPPPPLKICYNNFAPSPPPPNENKSRNFCPLSKSPFPSPLPPAINNERSLSSRKNTLHLIKKFIKHTSLLLLTNIIVWCTCQIIIHWLWKKTNNSINTN